MDGRPSDARHEVQKNRLPVRSAAWMGSFSGQHVLVNIRDDLRSKVTDFTLQRNETDQTKQTFRVLPGVLPHCGHRRGLPLDVASLQRALFLEPRV